MADELQKEDLQVGDEVYVEITRYLRSVCEFLLGVNRLTGHVTEIEPLGVHVLVDQGHGLRGWTFRFPRLYFRKVPLDV